MDTRIVTSFAAVMPKSFEFMYHAKFKDLKVVSTSFLLVYCVILNNEKCFLFHFESSLHTWDNQILTFEICKCHNLIKCQSMKHEMHFTK